MSDIKNRIINGDVLSVLKTLPDCSIDCCVTSPPYYALRDYGMDGQIGLEATPESYVERLTDVFMEVHRVLKYDGTLWLNIADSYWGGGWRGTILSEHSGKIQKGSLGTVNAERIPRLAGKTRFIKNKDLIGIPWMLALSLRDAGWYLRQDIIWSKPNPMPESVRDRCTKSHEYIFLLSKSSQYYYDSDAIAEPVADPLRTNFASGNRSNGINRDRNDNDLGLRSKTWKPKMKNLAYDGQRPNTFHINRALGEKDKQYPVRNKRDVWRVTVKPCKDAHFATFPMDLIRPCILAGCKEGGIVLDPFIGSGTTAIVAKELGRNYIGIELNPQYCQMADKRIKDFFGLFADTMDI